MLEVAVGNDRFDTDDERWVATATDFGRALRQEVPEADWRTRPVEGTKGAVTDIILTLGTSGALDAALAFFRAWLGRDKDRSVRLVWKDEGHEHSVSISGKEITAKSFDGVVSAAASRLRS